MSLPVTQAAVVVTQSGGPEVMQYVLDHPTPEPAEGHVLIQNAFCGINYVDTYFRSGFYESPKPEVLGREGSGVVVALGPSAGQAHELKVGDRVVWLGSGGYSQYTSVAVEKVIKVPEVIPLEDAAGCFLSGLTALALVDEAWKVTAGDLVLLHAGAGTVGILMIQILKDRGAKVIATAGGVEKCQVARNLGADHVIDYRSEEDGNWAEVVKTITGGRGVDVVYDSVGKDTWEGSLEAVKRKGMIVWLGNASGPVPPLTLHRLAPKCVKIARPTLMGYIATREEFEKYAHQLFDLLATGKLKTRIYKVYPLEEVQQAHRDLEGRKTIGKLLLKPPTAV